MDTSVLVESDKHQAIRPTFFLKQLFINSHMIDCSYTWLIFIIFRPRKRPLCRIECFWIGFPKRVGKSEVLHDCGVKDDNIFINVLGVEIKIGVFCNSSLEIWLPYTVFKLNNRVSHHKGDCYIDFYLHLIIQKQEYLTTFLSWSRTKIQCGHLEVQNIRWFVDPYHF